MKTLFLKFAFLFFICQISYSQCFQIESILVDACSEDGQEGYNEMVRFKVGTAPLNTANLNVNWPNNPWQGLVQNAITTSKVAALNTDVINAGGCGQLIQPTGGILPANATVILVTSYNFDTVSNSFGALTEDIYIIFQNNPDRTAGHFANYGTGFRTLTMSFGACNDVATYNRALLVSPSGENIASDGATVLFTPSGTATYVNYGCSAPVQPFVVDIINSDMTACAGDTIALTATAQGYQSLLWTAPSGSFSNPGSLTTSYTIPANASGTILLTLTATNTCGAEIDDTVLVTITNSIVPNFATSLALCAGTTAPTLNTTSPNGITGTWSPSVINNTANGSYVFTPNSGQCASPVTLNVTVTNSIVPDFATSLTLCTGTTAPALNTTSPNGITGTWSPSVINNTANGSYVFTPNSGQCAVPVTLNVSVTNSIVPDFATSLTLCTGTAAPTLNTTSPNGITGTWSPSVINNTANGSYVFTPNSGQCASPVTLNVTVTNSIVPDFATSLTLCTGTTAPALNTTSPNGITGTWSPSIINNSANGSYVFTPNSGQCAVPVTLNVIVTNSIVPDFDTSLTLCTGTTAPALNTTSPNGITGTWSPSVINNTANGSYVFTPNSGQCASPVTLNVSVTNSIVPDFATSLTLCTGTTAPALNTTSPNGITGTWSPSVINNTANGSYVFTPNSGQCAVPVTLNVSVTNSIVPDFDTSLTLCTGTTAPALNTTSPNGITGTWSPSIINNSANGSYVFTPNSGQCAVPVTLNVSVTNSIVPDFDTSLTLCTGTTAPALNTTSPNGITGTWSPSVINNTANGSYVFTPNSGQCAVPVTLNVTISGIVVSITGLDVLCPGQSTQWIPSIPGGTWSSNDTAIATIDSNGNITAIGSGVTTIHYVITGACETSASKTLEVINPELPNLTDRFVCVDTITGDIIVPVLLESGLSDTDYTFVWTLNGSVLPTTQSNHLATETGVYTVTATHVVTGCAVSASGTIAESSLAVAEAFVREDFQRNQVITVNVTGGSGVYEFSLNGGPFQTNNYFTNVLQGENIIVVRDKNGCGELILTVYSLKYPPFFTPNGDGYHDTWKISGLEHQSKSLIYIFDRYGKLIKTLKTSSGEGWDGTYNGENMPSTDYWFSLMYTNANGIEKEFKAHFSLKR